MPRVQRGIRVREIEGMPHMRSLHFGIHTELQKRLKQYPGVRWQPRLKYWQTPTELLDRVKDLGKRFDRPIIELERPAFKRASEINCELFPYHLEGIEMSMAQRHLMLNYEMGIGKTPSFIEIMRLAGIEDGLVVCPALVRRHWRAEFARWWPEIEVHLIESGKQIIDLPSSGWWVVSYELLPKLTPFLHCIGGICIDESHYIANARVKRSKVVRGLLNAYRKERINFLTATPITNRPQGLWHQLDSLWPERFGKYWHFINRYADFVENPYADSGFTPAGLKEATAPELRGRLQYCTKRLVRSDPEVAKYLPALNIVAVPVKPKKRMKMRELIDTLNEMRQHENKPDAFIRAMGSEKVGFVIKQAEEVIASGGRPALISYNIATAREYASLMVEKFPNLHICQVDGTIPIPKRMQMIEDAKLVSDSVLIASMKSINVGINLVEWTEPIFGEIYPTPGVMVQALGRFPRIGGLDSVTVYVIVMEGTHEEEQCATLREKVKDVSAAIRGGESETQLDNMLGELAKDDDDPFEALFKAACSKAEEDEYAG